jgi:acetyl esterase/lipase
LASQLKREGLFLRETAWRTGTTRDLMALNTHLAAVAWGRTTIIDYVNGSGKPAKAAVILPPDYRETNRYPVIAWVYGGYTVRGPNDYWLDPYLPGIYNLQLYAARGYVVVIPSLSRWSGRATQDIYGAAEEGLMPALDKLIELGIADPRRIGIMGQSLGGYNVYSLVTRTARFRAAVALAGFSDVTLLYSQFPRLREAIPASSTKGRQTGRSSSTGSLSSPRPTRIFACFSGIRRSTMSARSRRRSCSSMRTRRAQRPESGRGVFLPPVPPEQDGATIALLGRESRPGIISRECEKHSRRDAWLVRPIYAAG